MRSGCPTGWLVALTLCPTMTLVHRETSRVQGSRYFTPIFSNGSGGISQRPPKIFYWLTSSYNVRHFGCLNNLLPQDYGREEYSVRGAVGRGVGRQSFIRPHHPIWIVFRHKRRRNLYTPTVRDTSRRFRRRRTLKRDLLETYLSHNNEVPQVRVPQFLLD